MKGAFLSIEAPEGGGGGGGGGLLRIMQLLARVNDNRGQQVQQVP